MTTVVLASTLFFLCVFVIITQSALEDLTLLLKKDHNHVLGYVSRFVWLLIYMYINALITLLLCRGTLLAKIDRLSDAIQNYTRV